MGFHRGQDERNSHSDRFYEEDKEELERRKYLRKKIEERLEKKKLREEFDELDGEFDWDEFEP